MRKLTEMGAEIRVHDPYVEHWWELEAQDTYPAPGHSLARFFRRQEQAAGAAGAEGPRGGPEGRRRRGPGRAAHAVPGPGPGARSVGWRAARRGRRLLLHPGRREDPALLRAGLRGEGHGPRATSSGSRTRSAAAGPDEAAPGRLYGPRRKTQLAADRRGHTQTGPLPGHFTSRAGRSRKASGHDAVLRVLRMARNAADAAGSARPKGENFSASPAPKSPWLTGTNRTRRRQPPPGSRYLISLPISSMLKNFHEMFGFMPVDLPGIKPPACGASASF